MVGKKFERIVIDGKEVEQGYVLNKWFASRFKRNKNVLGVYVGATGSGKTYSALGQMESYYKQVFNEPFPKENICFSLDACVKRLRHGNLKRGEFLVVEEAGVLMGSLDFQSKIAKFFGYILQSFRSKNIGIIFTLPDMSMLNKTARKLLHIIILTNGIDTSTNEVILKPFYVQPNAMSGKDYHKYLRQKINGRYVKIERVRIGLPSADLIKIYEEMKSKFVDKVEEDFIELAEPKQKETPESIENKLDIAIDNLIAQGLERQTDIARKLGVSRQAVAKYFIKRAINGKINTNSSILLEKGQNSTMQPILAPLST